MTQLIQGVMRAHEKALDGALTGLQAAAAGITLDMRSDPSHGDQTGASHASYSARAVGRGEDGSALLAVARAAASAFNPAHVAPVERVTINGELGVIFDDPMDYGPDRETANAGAKAVEGPTVGASGGRLTQAAAAGSRRALGG